MTENSYKTKQRSLILDCLKQHSQASLSVDDIVDILKKQGNAVGRTTVYRYTDSLACEGMVRKYTQGRGKSSTYQYVENHDECHHHMHLKCISCGTLIHLDCDFMNDVCQHITEHHRFRVDNSRTTLFGFCEACLKRENCNDIDRM